ENAINALAAQRGIADLAARAEAIKHHHGLATKMADKAVHHAREAGRHLLEVKAALGHGQFGAWRRENLRVSVRQTQRYMAAALGKPTPLRALASESDTVLQVAEPTSPEPPEHLKHWFSPYWQPAPGHWHFAQTDEHGTVWVVADRSDSGLFHVSRIYEVNGESLYDGSKSPIPAWLVEDHLRVCYGIEDSWLLPWKSNPKPGLARPFGEPSHA
ncbi:MAG: DUF3102 domain-containing protein, partial [Burkholderiales bacterium]